MIVINQALSCEHLLNLKLVLNRLRLSKDASILNSYYFKLCFGYSPVFSRVGNRNGWTSAPGMRIASQVLGNRVGETDSQRSFDVQAWDAVENLVTRYDQPCNDWLVEERTNKFGMLPAEHLRSPLQNQLNWQVVYCYYLL